MPEPATPPALSASYRASGYALGFAIGGFFDGILLHQVLQWHHLFSGLEGGRFDDLRFQILADGLFHVLMYVIGGLGLWLLWRSRGEFGRPQADRLLTSNALIGFGAWHMIDGILSHWLLDIHRIKMDSEIPLFWDILWFAVFGVAFVVWGWAIRPRDPGSGHRMGAVPASIAALAVVGGAIALLPPDRGDDAATIVVFLPGTTPAEAMTAVASVGGSLLWTDPTEQVWAIDMPESAGRAGLYRNGAILVGNALLPVGCLNWFADPAMGV